MVLSGDVWGRVTTFLATETDDFTALALLEKNSRDGVVTWMVSREHLRSCREISFRHAKHHVKHLQDMEEPARLTLSGSLNPMRYLTSFVNLKHLQIGSCKVCETLCRHITTNAPRLETLRFVHCHNLPNPACVGPPRHGCRARVRYFVEWLVNLQSIVVIHSLTHRGKRCEGGVGDVSSSSSAAPTRCPSEMGEEGRVVVKITRPSSQNTGMLRFLTRWTLTDE
ncbi:unnamed protein product [Vitrella brassicaformis CCMP3155]|uniref:Uncharacterized protein n=2 Tax=Vitrella brassicaformis TaxID=1169539 RepID=A0A0G4FY00_VITBC|nr:unnamed protein product [Vitrella brassicaformis CCMP3155]|mmetsp:Transcript_13338/g.31825  ORF Transcript_13338/g.31825 Transcript_13338/m.31825 type:complete len:225 (+) Transcript_13338:65-739(+)|eukprot:CEM20029.1 unnamed protein product [Vitrella brassicaformis CCMP3155]